MKKALIIIDMQPHFAASCGKEILKEHIKQIRKAISNNHHIVVLEYDYGTNTHKKIQMALRNYKSVKYITKNTNSGSAKIVKHFKKIKFWPDEIDFIGVNTGACVKATVLNFHYHLKRNNKKTKIKVIKEGCRCFGPQYYGDFYPFARHEIEVV